MHEQLSVRVNVYADKFLQKPQIKYVYFARNGCCVSIFPVFMASEGGV